MPFFSESQALGTGSSPWTYAASDQLYPDNTDYRVGIGTTTVPVSSLVAASAVLQIGSTSKAAASLVLQDNEQKFEILNNGYLGFHCDNSEKMRLASDGKLGIGLTNASAFLHIKGVENTPTVKLETVSSGTTHKFFEFKNGASTTESNPPYLYPDNAGGYTRVRFKGSGAVTPFIFDDGVAFRGGGNAIQFDGGSANIGTTGVTMRIEVNTGFGLATSNFTPSGAMLHIKDASNAQLKLDDGSNHALLKHSGNDLTFNIDGGANNNLQIEADTGKFLFKSNAGSSATITLDANNNWSSFPYLGVTSGFEASTIKAGSFVSAPNGIIINYGLRFANVAKTGDYTMLASDHVVFCNCPSGTPGMTITLPASTAGRMVKIIDNAGSCSNGANEIRITPASGTINGATSVDIEDAYGSVFAICDGTNWTITN